MDCLPWWHTKFDDVPQFTVRKPGCSVGSDGNVPCDPEELRADAEAQIRAAGYNIDLSLEAYTLARYMQSEVGVGRIEAGRPGCREASSQARRRGAADRGFGPAGRPVDRPGSHHEFCTDTGRRGRNDERPRALLTGRKIDAPAALIPSPDAC